MTPLAAAVLAVAAVGLAYWLFQLHAVVRGIGATPRLKRLPRNRPGPWPRVSLVLTARNEADTIERGVRSRMAEDYPDLEIIVVDDRSEDRTGVIAERLAAEDRRITVVHVADLPAGWLGKLNALHQGTARATGEWLLFSDADVLFSDSAVRRAVAFCETNRLDHLAVLPELLPRSLMLDAVLAVFVRTLLVAGRVWKIRDPRSAAALGSGSFNLVRRAAFDRTPGFGAIKMNQGDDVALGVLLKRHGARGAVANGIGTVRVVFYETLRAAAVGSERPVFTDLGGFSLPRLLGVGLVLLLLELSPFATFIPVGLTWLPWAGVPFCLLALGTSCVAARWWNRPLLPSLLHPVGAAVQAWFVVRAGILGHRRGGVYWRGTFYPTAELRKYKKDSLKVL